MSKATDKVRRTFEQRLAEAASVTRYATVLEVDEERRTCKVQDGGITRDNVLLYSVDNSELKGLVLIPAVDSKVLINRLGNSSRLYVSMYSVVDKVLLTIGDKWTVTTDAEGATITADKTEVKIDETGISITADETTLQASVDGIILDKGKAGLKKTLSDLCDAIVKITVPTGTGPSGVPVNIAQFEEIKKGLNDYLK